MCLLRYAFSEEARNIYESLGLSDDEKKDTVTIIHKMKTFAKGIVNETLERHVFNTRNQQEGELFDDYLTELRMMMKNCNFCND